MKHVVIAVTAALAVASVLAGEALNHKYYGGGLDYSKWNLNGPAQAAHVPHQAAHLPHPIAPLPPVIPAHVEHVEVPATKSVHKEVYAVKPVYDDSHAKEGKRHFTIKFHKEPVLAYGVHPKGRSTTFTVPLFSAKNAPIVTLTNNFPKHW